MKLNSGVLCWETILHGSLTFLHILQVRHLMPIVPDYLFKEVYVAQNLGSKILSSSRAKDRHDYYPV